MNDSQQLLTEYAASGSETAFRELVSRYVDLVYSSALRLVDADTHLAEDVTQTVFADLAKKARTLSSDVMLGGWLHRHTCFVASNILRGERRRRERERLAMEMNVTEDHSAANLTQIAPVLDEAINELSAEDRAAIVLRYFEQRDFQSVGAALGGSEEAARKRVDRALDKLHGLLTRRGVTLSATVLASTLAASAVSAAPAGLAISVSSVALASAAAGGTTLTFLQIMSMTKLKIGIAGAVVVAAVAIPVVLQQKALHERDNVNAQLQQQLQRANQLESEKAELVKQLASAQTPAAPGANNASLETLRLRGEVGRLKNENASISAGLSNAPSAISGLRAKPEMWKAIREQQKMGMSMIYGDLAKRLKLTDEQKATFNDLLADHVMASIDDITGVLTDKKTPAEADAVFAAQEAALVEKVRALLGDDAVSQFKDYTKNLASHITAEQFKGMMTGEKEEKDAKAKQFYEILQAETTQTLADAGLPSDYQLVPTFNFRNFPFEAEAEKNLGLLDGVYERAIAKASNFLSPDEVKKFADFRKQAIDGNKMALAMNRQLMSPGQK